MLFGVSIFGEITNLKQSGKSTYFDIKDDSASLPCVAFNSSLLEGIKVGDKVTIKGQLNFYTKLGRLSFIASKITKLGIGELYQRFVELKAKLEKEGVFDQRYKKSIPELSKKIGVVTSETGAVIHDIINVTRRKNKNIDIVLYPVKVQGVGALEEIIAGINFLDNYDVDCIIVARGGGSFEDYAPFNTEEIVRTVFGCKKPLISAIGHETDWSLIDFVADLRAATPSVAAEIAVFDMEGYIQNLQRLAKRLSGLGPKIITKRQEYIAGTINSILQTSRMKLKSASYNLLTAVNNNTNYISKVYDLHRKKFEFVTQKIELNNPLNILKKGYAQVLSKQKRVTSVSDVEIDEKINIIIADGTLSAKITDKKEN